MAEKLTFRGDRSAISWGEVPFPISLRTHVPVSGTELRMTPATNQSGGSTWRVWQLI